MQTTYTVVRLTEYTTELEEFLHDNVYRINRMFGNKYSLEDVQLEMMLKRGMLLVCKRNGRIRGIHISMMSESIFSAECKILRQVLFYVEPGNSRAAYHLFQKFIDIGKDNANHIITMLTSCTNVKPSTLERYGFKKLETLYRLEV